MKLQQGFEMLGMVKKRSKISNFALNFTIKDYIVI